MAKVTVVPPTAPEFVLTLSIEESNFLIRLLGSHITGTGSDRKLSDGIYDALHMGLTGSKIKLDTRKFPNQPFINVGDE